MPHWSGRFGWASAKPTRTTFWVEVPATVSASRPSLAASQGPPTPRRLSISLTSATAAAAAAGASQRRLSQPGGHGDMSSAHSSAVSLVDSAGSGWSAASSVTGVPKPPQRAASGLSKRPSITLGNRRDSLGGEPKGSRRVSWSDDAVFGARPSRLSESPSSQPQAGSSGSEPETLAALRRKSAAAAAGGQVILRPRGSGMRRSSSDPSTASLNGPLRTWAWPHAAARHSFSERSPRVTDNSELEGEELQWGVAPGLLPPFARRRNSLVGQTVHEEPSEAEENIVDYLEGIEWRRLSDDEGSEDGDGEEEGVRPSTDAGALAAALAVVQDWDSGGGGGGSPGDEAGADGSRPATTRRGDTKEAGGCLPYTMGQGLRPPPA